MALANQYGINMGNILSTASNIQTAKLNNKLRNEKYNEYNAGKKLKVNYLAKEQGKPPVYSQSDIDTASAVNPDTAIAIQDKEKAEKFKTNLTQFYINKGLPKTDAEIMANGHANDIINFNKEYRLKSKDEQKKIRDNIAQMGATIQNIIEVAKTNPQDAEKMYQNYRNTQNDKIKELYKTGQTKLADKMQEGLDKAPTTLLNKDGSFNAEFPMLSLGKLNAMITDADTWDKLHTQTGKTGETQQLLNLLNTTKDPKKRAYIKARLNVLTKGKNTGTPTKLAKLYKMLDTETDPARRKQIKAVIYNMTQPKLYSLGTNIHTVDDMLDKFALKLGLPNSNKLATVDTSKFTPEQQAEAQKVASVYIKGLGVNAKVAEKKMAEYGAMAEQAQNALNAYKKVSNFRLLDETTKKYISNWTGLSKKELESSEAAMALQSLLNIKIKADSGSAVSGNEMVRNTLETASPDMTKKKILLGIKNLAQRQIGALKGLKRVMGAIPFNLQYGSVLKNYMDIKKAANDQIFGKSGDKSDDNGKTPSVAKLRGETQSKTPQFKEGDTATNPQTGEHIIFHNGKWEKTQ